MGPLERAAKLAASEARRKDTHNACAEARASYGDCPLHYGHFDLPSFVAGGFIICIIAIVAHFYG